ncbi:MULTISPECIES: helix-turn-helix domain-containing protein [Clostridiaceae]|uniref:Transcriptional regulator n=1 Tax=Clostridium facile TaxID=2763035 RepID=A0ABR7IQK2_9CLOT|nr:MULTISPECIES: helix-turn-helix domain-containing protein [Clostridiaceae]MBC5787334.1 transcriptional regulator [Clostridium facile]PWM99987.1 MAG: transcriptional regulator [Massilioclostridium sp.]
MNLNEAVQQRILNLCKEKSIPLNQLTYLSNLSPADLEGLINKSKDIDIITTNKLCVAFQISLKEFFDDDLFRK